jgi:hypothetical protein
MVTSSSSDLRHGGIELRVGDGDLLNVLEDGRKSSSRRYCWVRTGVADLNSRSPVDNRRSSDHARLKEGLGIWVI